jgi:apolipoprotein N-acyltransferase
MQVADATGVHGITFVLVAVNAALAELWCAARARRRLAASAAGIGFAGIAVLASLAYGAFRLGAPAVGRASHDGVSVGIVQAYLPLGSQWRREFYGRNLATYQRLSRDLLGSVRPSLLVWPESAMTFFLADEATYRRSIAALLAPFGAELLAGGPYAVPGSPGTYLNSAFLVSPTGEILGRYDKRLLLPFAESFPLGRIDLLRRAVGQVREFVPGERTTLLGTSIGPAGVIICNEGFFPEPAAERVRDGATIGSRTRSTPSPPSTW